MIAKFVAGLFGFILILTISVLVMIYGWGLEPVSWWWIIGGGVFGKLLVLALEAAVKEEQKKA